MATSNSDANHVVLHAQNDRQGLGPMDISNAAGIHAVLHSQINRRSLGHIETCNSDPKSLFCMQKPQMRAGTHKDLQFWY